MTPLIVIDVQDRFINDLDFEKPLLVAQVVKAVRKARKENRHIFLVQYRGHGPTNRSVKKAVANYDKVHIVTKYADNGGLEVWDALQSKKVRHKTLTVCGVNLGACVASTVNDLVYRGYKCRLVKEATVNTWDAYAPMAKTYFSLNKGTARQIHPSIKLTSVRYA